METEFDDLDFSDIDTDVKDFAELKKGFNEIITRVSEYAKKKKAAKAGYPYPDEKMMAADKQKMMDLEQKCKKFEEENQKLNEQVKQFTEKEKAGKINTLVNLQEEKGLITSDDKVPVAESFKSFSAEQIDALIANTSKMASTGQQKSFKGQEPGTQKGQIDADKTAKIADLRTKIGDFNEAGLYASAREMETELHALEG